MCFLAVDSTVSVTKKLKETHEAVSNSTINGDSEQYYQDIAFAELDMLGDYSKEKKDNSDICDMTGLSEKAVSRLLLYKSQYSDNVDSLNFLLESDNLEDVLYHMLKRSFKEQLKKNKK